MVNDGSAALDRTFRALADPTRRAMVSRLAHGELTVGELAEPFLMSAPAVSKHLKVLESAGLVERERAGRVHRLRLVTGRLDAAEAWIGDQRRFWESTLASLDRFLAAERPSRRAPRARRRSPHAGS